MSLPASSSKMARLHSMDVTGFLGRTPSSPTLQDELDWFEKVRTTDSICAWGIYVQKADLGTEDWLLIGSYSVNRVEGTLFSTAVSGVVIFRKEYWGRGVSSACHRARTMYAFDVLGYVCVRSAVFAEHNQASDRAIRGVGYVPIGEKRNYFMRGGERIHATEYELINPF